MGSLRWRGLLNTRIAGDGIFRFLWNRQTGNPAEASLCWATRIADSAPIRSYKLGTSLFYCVSPYNHFTQLKSASEVQKGNARKTRDSRGEPMDPSVLNRFAILSSQIGISPCLGPQNGAGSVVCFSRLSLPLQLPLRTKIPKMFTSENRLRRLRHRLLGERRNRRRYVSHIQREENHKKILPWGKMSNTHSHSSHSFTFIAYILVFPFCLSIWVVVRGKKID